MSNTKQDETPSSSTPPPYMDNKHKPQERQEMVRACEKIIATRYHDPKEAMRLANELCSKHHNNSLAHFTRGQVIGFYCGDLHDFDKSKKNLLKETIYSFKRAADIMPELPEYKFHVAQASFQLARLEHENYQVVIQECERALNMDLFNQLQRMNDAKREHYEKMKENLENLITAAKVGQKNDVRNVISDIPQARNMKKQTELIIRKNDRKLELRKDFVKKTGEYWRKLSFGEKCRILDVKVKDVEQFFRSGENKNLQALGILKEAVDLYKAKNHWVTWSCCICKEDRRNDDYNVWHSLENHINKHFDDSEPMVTGTYEYKCVGCYDSLEISNEAFILHSILVKRLIIGDSYDDPIPNNKFLSQWLMKEPNIKLELELWEKKRDRTAQDASRVFEEIVKLNERIKVVLAKYEKQKKEAAEDTQTILPDQISFLKDKIISFKREVARISAYDYREILLPLLKRSIQANLIFEAEKQAKIEADSIMEKLISEDTKKSKSVPKKPKSKRKKDNKTTKVAYKIDVKSEEGSGKSVIDRKQEEGKFNQGNKFELGKEFIQKRQIPIAKNKEDVRPGQDMQQDGDFKEESELDVKKQFVHEDSESKIPAPNSQDKQACCPTSMEETKILIGTIPITVKNSKKGSKQDK